MKTGLITRSMTRLIVLIQHNFSCFGDRNITKYFFNEKLARKNKFLFQIFKIRVSVIETIRLLLTLPLSNIDYVTIVHGQYLKS